MPRTELTEKRTATSKTFDNGDGTLTLHAHIGPIHHQKSGAWVDTDVNWSELSDRFGAGEYPYALDFRKATRTLAIDFGNGDVLTLTPRNMKVPTSVVRSGNSVTLVRLWTGITLKCILTPEGVAFHYVKTGETVIPEVLPGSAELLEMIEADAA